MGHEVIILNKKFGYGPVNRYRFASWVKDQLDKEDYDVIHVHTTSVGTFLKIYRLNYVYTTHSRYWLSHKGLKGKFILFLERRVVKYAKKVISVSPKTVDLIKGHCNPYVIPNGVDMKLYKPDYEKRKGTKLVCLGEIVPHKKFDLIVRAAKDLDCKVILIGPKRDPNYVNKLKQMGGDKVIFTGEITEDEMIKTLSRSDIFLHPSIAEAFSMAVIEAMSCGLPLIASDICKDQVFDGLNGFAIPTSLDDEERVKIIRDKIKLLLADESLRNHMAESSRNIVLERYSWEKIVEKVIKVYEDFLKN
jgi:glycosyltransferase involved in cell wall biosynthesis